MTVSLILKGERYDFHLERMKSAHGKVTDNEMEWYEKIIKLGETISAARDELDGRTVAELYRDLKLREEYGTIALFSYDNADIVRERARKAGRKGWSALKRIRVKLIDEGEATTRTLPGPKPGTSPKPPTIDTTATSVAPEPKTPPPSVSESQPPPNKVGHIEEPNVSPLDEPGDTPPPESRNLLFLDGMSARVISKLVREIPKETAEALLSALCNVLEYDFKRKSRTPRRVNE